MMSVLGLDGAGFLRSGDAAERSALMAMTFRAAEIQAEARQDLAVRIVNTLSKAIKKN